VKVRQSSGKRRGIRDVFSIIRRDKEGRRPYGGGVFFISYNPQLFRNKKSATYSYARVLYERVTKTTLRQDEKIVAWGCKGLPEPHQLVVLPKGVPANETTFTYWLSGL
jgi:hypothetical protein